MPDFLPRSDSALSQWLQIFAAALAAAPSRYNAPPERVAECQTRVADYVAAAQRVADPGACTSVSVREKDAARTAAVAITRELSAIARAMPGQSAAALIALGLRPRKPMRRGTRPAPARAPRLQILSTRGNLVRLRLTDAENIARARPVNADRASIWYAVGETLGAGTQWLCGGMFSKTFIDLTLPTTLPRDTKVWLAARWETTTDRCSPFTPPTPTRITDGFAIAA